MTAPSPKHRPRRLDHVVLPVAELDLARERYEKLGFVVAPDGKHPFGTENCCVFLADGTFLEPLAVASRETCELHEKRGNTFIENDQAFRFRRGEEGFSHLVIKSDDAAADDRAFRRDGIHGGSMVQFGRDFETPSGEKGRVSFKLAFAGDKRAPDAGFFACEVMDAPKIDRSALTAHENGVTGICEILASEVNPTDFQYLFQSFLNQREMGSDSFGMSFETDGATVSVHTPAGMKAFYNHTVETVERGLRFQGVVFEVDDLEQTASYLKSAGIEFEERGGRLLVHPAPGQGTLLVFGDRK